MKKLRSLRPLNFYEMLLNYALISLVLCMMFVVVLSTRTLIHTIAAIMNIQPYWRAIDIGYIMLCCIALLVLMVYLEYRFHRKTVEGYLIADFSKCIGLGLIGIGFLQLTISLLLGASIAAVPYFTILPIAGLAILLLAKKASSKKKNTF